MLGGHRYQFQEAIGCYRLPNRANEAEQLPDHLNKDQIINSQLESNYFNLRIKYQDIVDEWVKCCHC